MTRPLTPETLVYGIAAASDPRVSPDGTRIVYTVVQACRDERQPTSQLWLCDVDGGNARRLTWQGERNRGGRWSPDGRAIAYVAGRGSTSAIRLLPLADGGEARELTEHAQGVADLAWSPDGKNLAYTTRFDPDNPDESERPASLAPRVRVTRRIDYKQDNRGYLADARTQVFVVDVAGGERRRLTSEPVDHDFPQWSPDGKTIATKVPNHNGMYSQLGLTDVVTGATTPIGPPKGAIGGWAWSPSGDRIVFAGDTAQTWQFDFFVYDVASGETRRLTDDLQPLPHAGYPTLVPPSQPVWLDDRRVLFHAIRGGASGLYELDTENGAVEPVHAWEALHAGLSVDAAKRYAVQTQATFDRTGELVVFDRETGEATTITRQSADVLAESPPATWEKFTLRRGEFEIEAWLLKPPGFDPAKRYPLVIDVHGGPNNYYGYNFSPLQQCLATNGFLVVFANPRGSSSYGRHFTQQVIRDWGGEDFGDLMAVVDRVLERPYADAERTGIYGYSYGGYMTAWTIGQTDRFRAAVCGAPVFDLESFYGTSDIGHVIGEIQCGGPLHELAEFYAAHSPSTFAHRARTPTLIFHGEADDRCPIGQGEQLFVALTKASCETEFVRYPGASHLFMAGGFPAHRADALTRVLAWFKEHLGEPI